MIEWDVFPARSLCESYAVPSLFLRVRAAGGKKPEFSSFMTRSRVAASARRLSQIRGFDRRARITITI